MKKLFTLFIALSFVTVGFAQVSLFLEDFENNVVNDGINASTPSYTDVEGNWSSAGLALDWTIGVAPLFSVQDISGNKKISIVDIPADTEFGSVGFGLVKSKTINISGKNEVYVELKIDATGSSYTSLDYIDIIVKVDGQNVASQTYTDGQLNGLITYTSADLSGDDLIIEIKGVNGTTDPIYLDDIKVIQKYDLITHATIRSIQETSNPTGASPEVGNIVTIRATVTASTSDGFYVQDTDGSDTNGDAAADWSGIYIDDATTNLSPNRLDIVHITGTVDEVNNRTEIIASKAELVEALGGNEFVPNLIVGPLTEKDESVLSLLVNSRILAQFTYSGADLKTINVIADNSDGDPLPFEERPQISIDQDLATLANILAEEVTVQDVTGITNFKSGTFRISPREQVDIVGYEVPVAVENASIDANRISAISNIIVLETASATKASIYNLAGQMVKQLNVQEGRTEIEMNAGVYVVKMNVGNDVITEKVLVK